MNLFKQQAQPSPLKQNTLDIIFKEGVASLIMQEGGESYSLYRQDYESLLGQNWLRTQALDLLLKIQLHKFSTLLRKTFAGRGELNQEQHSQYVKVVDAFVATLLMTNTDPVILESLAPLQLFSSRTKYLLIPINTEFKQGQHWLLALFKNGNYQDSQSESCLYILDSGWGGAHVGENVKNNLQFFYEFLSGKKLEIKLSVCEVPKQSNSFDCGIYTIGFAEYLLNEIVEELQEQTELQVNRLCGKYKYLLSNSKTARQKYRQMLQSKLRLNLQ